jgi:GGDEF domain-containing protein
MNNIENYFISIDDYIFCPPILAAIKHQLNCEQVLIYKLDQEGELDNMICASDEEHRFLTREYWEQIDHNSIVKKLLSQKQKHESDIDDAEDDTLAMVKSELIMPIHLRTPEIIELNHNISLWGVLLIYDYNYRREWNSAEHKFVADTVEQMTLAIERGIIYQQFKRLEKKVQSEQFFEHSTGLVNYSYFLDCLDYEWCNLSRYQKPVSVILIEINHPLTLELANIIQNKVQRRADLVARYSYNQIMVMLPGTDNTGALFVNKQITEKVENYHQGNDSYQCRSSIVTCVPKPKQDYELLLQTVEKPFTKNCTWSENIYNQQLL